MDKTGARNGTGGTSTGAPEKVFYVTVTAKVGISSDDPVVTSGVFEYKVIGEAEDGEYRVKPDGWPEEITEESTVHVTTTLTPDVAVNVTPGGRKGMWASASLWVPGNTGYYTDVLEWAIRDRLKTMIQDAQKIIDYIEQSE